MGLKRKLSAIDFSIDVFVKKFQDPSTTFLSLSEFNENAIENGDLVEQLFRTVPHFDIAHLLSETKRKSSETITLYRFLTHLLVYFVRTDRIHHADRLISLFNKINLKSLVRLYRIDEQRTRANVHKLLTIVLNSKRYGIGFVDVDFRPHSNAIIGKLVVDVLLKHVEHDEFQANLVVNCLRTYPNLLANVWTTISNRFDLRNEKFVEFLTEIVQQQKNFNEWNDIWMCSNDSSKLIDIFVQLTIPIEIFAKFMYNKSTIRFLAEVIQRIMQALDILQHLPLACDKPSTIQGYQQATLRV